MWGCNDTVLEEFNEVPFCSSLNLIKVNILFDPG